MMAVSKWLFQFIEIIIISFIFSCLIKLMIFFYLVVRIFKFLIDVSKYFLNFIFGSFYSNSFNEIGPLEAKLFFQLIDLRYTKKSTILTSNLTFEKWPQILGNDEMITKAILDRILHHCYLFNITGPSYRIKDKLKLNNEES